MTPNNIPQTLDNVLYKSGHQIKNYIIFGYPCILVVCYALSYIFVTADLNYRCAIPECENISDSHYNTSWINKAIPYNIDGQPLKCYRYMPLSGSIDCDNQLSFNRSNIVKCKSWIFETDEINLLNEFNLECDENKWKLSLIGSLDGLGAIIGSPICAFISDRYGRRFALSLLSTLCIILGIIRSFSVNYIMYAVLDFCNSVFDFGLFGTIFVLCMEVVSSHHRVTANIILNLFCCSGYILLGSIGIWVHDWKWMLRIFYGCGIFLSLYYWISPESMRWLMIKNRHLEAEKELKKIIGNLSELDVKTLLNSIEDNENHDLGYIATFRLTLSSPKLLKRLTHSAVCWVGTVFLFYATVQQSVSLSGDKHLNFIYSAVAQIPGYLASSFSMKVGHRITLVSSLVVCSAVCLMFYFISPVHVLLRQGLFLLGISGITSAYSVLYINTVEMFPTPLRQSLLAICNMIGRVGQVIAPQVFLLGVDLSLLIFGIVALIISALAIFLPETLNMKLPNTVKQAEDV